jgi:hypothetical protein
MEVGQGPNWGCSAKEKKLRLRASLRVSGNAVTDIIVLYRCQINRFEGNLSALRARRQMVKMEDRAWRALKGC